MTVFHCQNRAFNFFLYVVVHKKMNRKSPCHVQAFTLFTENFLKAIPEQFLNCHALNVVIIFILRIVFNHSSSG